MKYSFMSFSTPKLSLDETIRVASDFGYDGIEPRIDAQHEHGIEVDTTSEQRHAIKARIEASGIELSCLGTSLSYSDPEKLENMLKQTHERIDLAGDLAIPAIRVFGGMIAEGISREQAISNLLNALSSVADHAAERDVKLCVETHDDWCAPNHVAAVMKAVNHDAVRVNWDIMHPVRTKKMGIEDSFETLKPWISHLHVHDGIGESATMVPMGTGDIDHKTAIHLLMSIDYQGHISGEWIGWDDYKTELPRELAVMKQYEQDFN